MSSICWMKLQHSEGQSQSGTPSKHQWLWLKFGASGDHFLRISNSFSMTYELWRAGPTCGSSSAVALYLHPI